MKFFNFRKKHIFLLVFLLIFFIYLQTQQRQGKEFFLAKISYFLLGEAQTTSVMFRSEISSLIKKYLFLTQLREKNLQLETENSRLLSRQNLLKEIQQENKRLKEALAFYQNSSFSLLPAQVIAKDFLYQNNLIVINKGSRHGVKKHMGVIHPKGVVGYVFRTTPHSAQVITLLSKFSSLPALNQKTRINGLIVSTNFKNLNFKYFKQEEMAKTFQKGDVIITSATDQFPSGLPVGDIQKLKSEKQNLNPTVIVKPYVSFSSLEEVFVLSDFQKRNYEN